MAEWPSGHGSAAANWRPHRTPEVFRIKRRLGWTAARSFTRLVAHVFASCNNA